MSSSGHKAEKGSSAQGKQQPNPNLVSREVFTQYIKQYLNLTGVREDDVLAQAERLREQIFQKYGKQTSTGRQYINIAHVRAEQQASQSEQQRQYYSQNDREGTNSLTDGASSNYGSRKDFNLSHDNPTKPLKQQSGIARTLVDAYVYWRAISMYAVWTLLVQAGIVAMIAWMSFIMADTYAREQFSWAFVIGRATGHALKLTLALIPLSMLKNVFTWLQGTSLGTLIPHESPFNLQKFLGYLCLLLSGVHLVAHAVAYGFADNTDKSKWDSITQTTVAPIEKLIGISWEDAEYVKDVSEKELSLGKQTFNTGIIMFLCVLVMCLYQSYYPRKLSIVRGTAIGRHLNRFSVWSVVLYVPVYILVINHVLPAVPGSTYKQRGTTWCWLLLPVLLYILDKGLGFYRIKTTKVYVERLELLAGDMMVITLQKPANFKFQSGMHINLRYRGQLTSIPVILSSGPDDPFLRVHLRVRNDVTEQLRNKLLEAATQQAVYTQSHAHSRNNALQAAEEGRATQQGPGDDLAPPQARALTVVNEDAESVASSRTLFTAVSKVYSYRTARSRDRHAGTETTSFAGETEFRSTAEHEAAQGFVDDDHVTAEGAEQEETGAGLSELKGSYSIFRGSKRGGESRASGNSSSSSGSVHRQHRAPGMPRPQPFWSPKQASKTRRAGGHGSGSGAHARSRPVAEGAGDNGGFNEQQDVHTRVGQYVQAVQRQSKRHESEAPFSQPTMYIDGPYASRLTAMARQDVAILVASGASLSPFLSVLRSRMPPSDSTDAEEGKQTKVGGMVRSGSLGNLLRGGARGANDVADNKLVFIWIVKYWEWLSWMQEDLEGLMKLSSQQSQHVQIIVYVASSVPASKGEQDTKELFGWSKRHHGRVSERAQQCVDIVQQEHVQHLAVKRGVSFHCEYGQPEWGVLLSRCFDMNMTSTSKPYGVFVCGSKVLCTRVQQSCKQGVSTRLGVLKPRVYQDIVY